VSRFSSPPQKSEAAAAAGRVLLQTGNFQFGAPLLTGASSQEKSRWVSYARTGENSISVDRPTRLPRSSFGIQLYSCTVPQRSADRTFAALASQRAWLANLQLRNLRWRFSCQTSDRSAQSMAQSGFCAGSTTSIPCTVVQSYRGAWVRGAGVATIIWPYVRRTTAVQLHQAVPVRARRRHVGPSGTSSYEALEGAPPQ
jgi:hypothetical protein